MRSFIEVITTPTADSAGTCLLLHFDNKRYMVGNAHEGLQRAMIQRGKKLHKVTDIFLTGKTEWKNTGGLLGIILTLADSLSSAAAALRDVAKQSKDGKQTRKAQSKDQAELKRRSLIIHGTPNVTHTLATSRRFVFRKGMPVDVNEIKEQNSDGEWKPTWSDENIQVWAMSIEPLSLPTALPASPTSSPAKRSFDQYAEATDSKEEDYRNQQLRRGVLTHMFNSDWRLDALFETPLAEVKMPAALFIRDAVTNKIEKYSGPLPGGAEPLPEINVLVRRPWPGALVTDLPQTKPSPTALSYIIRNHLQRGKFSTKKAIDLNVPPGPLFSELAAGRPVTAEDGKTVLPGQVLGTSRPGGGIAVVELPSEDYVSNLVARPEWRTRSVMEGVGAVFWILGPNVIRNESLKKFMLEFSKLEHIVSSQDCCPNYLSLDSAATGAIRLFQIDPERFAIPTHDNGSPLMSAGEDTALTEPVDWKVAKRGHQIQLAPDVVVKNDSTVPALNTAKVLEETPKAALFLAKAIRSELASKEAQREHDAQDLPSPDAEIIFLGTGSALPSKYRNVSATLLRVPGSGSYLFDCGENTLGQLSRMYTKEQLGEVLQDLKMIWISHMHADHHLGITSVIKAWYQAVHEGPNSKINSLNPSAEDQLLDPDMYLTGQKRLFVASEDNMIRWLAEYASVEDFGYNKLVPLCVRAARPGKPDTTQMHWDRVQVGFNTNDTKLNEAMKEATGLTSLAAANVMHCHGAKGISVTFPTGFKFTYSGDCRPSRSLAEIGKDSTVLLHEATFEDELRGDAQAKLHSTISEALGVGMAMGARRVLLTHFSQRYQRLPVMDMLEGQSVDLEDEGSGAEDDLMTGMDTGETPLAEMVEDGAAVDSLLVAENPATPASDGPRIRSVHNARIQKGRHDMKVGVAFDYMRVKVKDIMLLEKFTPALLKLYEGNVGDSESEGDEGEKARERKGGNVNRAKEKKVGGGRMGRVPQTDAERERVRSGRDLFGDPGRQLAAAHAP